MPHEIIVPRLGWSMEEGAFVAWLKKDGEFVQAGDALFSIEGDKAVQEVESMDSGILRIALHAPPPGAPIRVGDLLGHLLSREEAAATISTLPPRHSTATTLPSAEKFKGNTVGAGASSSVEAGPTLSPSAVVPSSAGSVETKRQSSQVLAISPRALRLAVELGVDWTTMKGSGRTGRIRERDVRAAANPGLVGAVAVDGSGAAESASARSGISPDRSTFLVTGGCGFIGTWVIRELLGRGHRVVVLDAGGRPTRWERIIGPGAQAVELVQGSLFDRGLLARTFANHAITHVIHLAALLTPACQEEPWDGFQVNVQGTMALLEQLRAAGDRVKGFSYASSVAVFGDEPDHATGSAGENLPVTFYGAFKKSIELLAVQYWRHFRLSSVGVRPQVVYGPEREVGLTAGPSLAAKALARGEDYQIGYTGRVGYDFVEDVARAFVQTAWETPAGAHLVDLAGEVIDVERIVSALVRAVPRANGRVTAKGPLLPAHAPPSPRYITELFPDWKTTSIEEGLRRTVEFYREQALA